MMHTWFDESRTLIMSRLSLQEGAAVKAPSRDCVRGCELRYEVVLHGHIFEV